MIIPSPKFCEIFRNAVICYGIEFLALRPSSKV